MRKFIVSSIVIIGFVAYSFYQRVFGAQAVPAIMPNKINPTPTTTSQLIPIKSGPTFTPTPTKSGQAQTPTPTNSNKNQTAPTNLPTPTAQNTPTPTPKPSSKYKDGTFTGDAADAFYGLIQVQATIANGRITDVKFLQAPNDRSTSIMINSQADPMLATEAIQAQSAQVDVVSGATDSSQAFVQSMQSALDKAKN